MSITEKTVREGKSTTDGIYARRQLQERYNEGQQYLHTVSVCSLIWKKIIRQSPVVRADQLWCWCLRDKGAREVQCTGEGLVLYHQ